MEDIESSGVIDQGSSVILNCEKDRYIGFLQGVDETFLYLKATHKWGEVAPEVTEESEARLRAILDARPTWMLRAQVAWKYRMVSMGLSREDALDMLTEWAKMEALDAAGTIDTFLPHPKAIHMAIPHMNIDTMESLRDVLGGKVLAGLDFKDSEEYNDEYGDESDEED